MTEINLQNQSEYPDEKLDELRIAIINEQERRYFLKNAALQMEQINADYEVAIGRSDGDTWAQPTGAHDAYRKGAVVSHNGKTWESLTPVNVWEPGVSGWREKTAPGAAPAAFKQPTGAQDVYKKGDKVTFKGSVYVSTIDNNSWSPETYPQGWSKA